MTYQTPTTYSAFSTKPPRILKDTDFTTYGYFQLFIRRAFKQIKNRIKSPLICPSSSFNYQLIYTPIHFLPPPQIILKPSPDLSFYAGIFQHVLLNLDTMDILGQIILRCGDCPMHWAMFTAASLTANGTAPRPSHPEVVTTNNVPRH